VKQKFELALQHLTSAASNKFRRNLFSSFGEETCG